MTAEGLVQWTASQSRLIRATAISSTASECLIEMWTLSASACSSPGKPKPAMVVDRMVVRSLLLASEICRLPSRSFRKWLLPIHRTRNQASDQPEKASGLDADPDVRFYLISGIQNHPLALL